MSFTSSRWLFVPAIFLLASAARSGAGESPVLYFRSGNDVELRRGPSEPGVLHAVRPASAPVVAPIAPVVAAAAEHRAYSEYFRISDLKIPCYLRVQITGPEMLTGYVVVAGQRVNFSGSLSDTFDGEITFTDAAGDDVVYPYTLTLESIAGHTALKGEFDFDGHKATLHLGRRLLETPHAGYYTVALPASVGGEPEPTVPQPKNVVSLTTARVRPLNLGGAGYGVLRISRHGAVRLAVKLADGHAAGLGGYFDTTTSVPVFTRLYATRAQTMPGASAYGTGYLGGLLRFRDRPHYSDISGILRWNRPSRFNRHGPTPGFAVFQPIIAARYTPFDERLSIIDGVHYKIRDTVIRLHSGGLPTDISVEGTVDGDYIKAHNADFHADFSATYGFFRGAFHHPGPHQDVAIRGVIIQKQNRAFGEFFDQFHRSGTVSIEAAPKPVVPAATPAPTP